MNQTYLNDGEARFERGYMGAIAAGYKVDFYILSRLEAEFSGRNNDLDYVVGSWGDRYYLLGRARSYSLFANAYWDINTFCGITPYIGYGYGYSFMNTKISGRNFEVEGSDSFVVHQFIGGFKTPLNEFIDVGLEYRYFLARAMYREQNVGITFTLKI